MKSQYLGCYTVPDGFFGNTQCAHVVLLENGRTIDVFRHGFHTSPVIPPVSSKDEAIWLIDNHPRAKKYYRAKS